MRVVQAIAEILKREGVEFLIAYPLNPLIEACAEAGIRPIIVRQERTGIHMADAHQPPELGRQGRRVLHAGRPGHRERVRRRRAGLLGVGAAGRASRRLGARRRPGSSPASTRRSTTSTSPSRAEAAQHARRRGRRPAPRLHAGPQRPPRPRAARSARRRLERGSAGHDFDYTAGDARRLRRRTRRDVDEAADALIKAERPHDLRRPGRALRRRPGTS